MAMVMSMVWNFCFYTNPYDPADLPSIDPLPAYKFVDEGIDEDTNFTPYGLGMNVDEENPTGALIDEDPINGHDDDGDGLTDEDDVNFARDGESEKLAYSGWDRTDRVRG